MEFECWNTIQAREKLSYVHVVSNDWMCSDWTLDVVFIMRVPVPVVRNGI